MSLQAHLVRKIVYPAHDYIENNLDKPFSIRALADFTHFSYSRFRHLYEEVTGEPVWQYIKRYRLEYAGGLLRHSGFSCSEIADRVGYASKHAFSKAFSGHFGISPGSFRALKDLPLDRDIRQGVYENFFDEIEYALSGQQEGLVRMERLVSKVYYYRRFHAASREDFLKWINGLPEEFGDKQMVFSCPDVICVSATAGIRLNYGFLADNAITEEGKLLQKRITAQKYLVTPYRKQLALLPWYVYQLIDVGKKGRIFSISSHDVLVMISPGNGAIELWIPVNLL